MLPIHRPFAMRIGLILALVATAVPASVTASQAAGAPEISIYAAPRGHGRDCSRAAPCSIRQAKLAAADRARHVPGNLRVVLAGGTYALSAPLTFGPADSGRAGHRIIWTAAPGQRPVISGGTPVTGFAPTPTNPLLWSAPVPAGLQTRQLYADGVRLPRASGPSPVGLTQTSSGYQAIPTGSMGRDATLASENAFELLSPGHWYLDESAHVLYYYARASDDVRGMHFVAPRLQQLLVTTSTADNPLHDVTFQGIDFAYATWLQPSGDDGFVEMQANMTLTGAGAATRQGLCGYISPAGTCPFASWTRPPAAVDLTGTKRVSVLGNTFEHLGAAGLGLMPPASSRATHVAPLSLTMSSPICRTAGSASAGAAGTPMPRRRIRTRISTRTT